MTPSPSMSAFSMSSFFSSMSPVTCIVMTRARSSGMRARAAAACTELMPGTTVTSPKMSTSRSTTSDSEKDESPANGTSSVPRPRLRASWYASSWLDMVTVTTSLPSSRLPMASSVWP